MQDVQLSGAAGETPDFTIGFPSGTDPDAILNVAQTMRQYANVAGIAQIGSAEEPIIRCTLTEEHLYDRNKVAQLLFDQGFQAQEMPPSQK